MKIAIGIVDKPVNCDKREIWSGAHKRRLYFINLHDGNVEDGEIFEDDENDENF